MIKSIMGIVGIKIDEKYNCNEGFFNDKALFNVEEKEYEKCKQFLEIKYTRKIDYSEAREVAKGIYGCNKFIYDKEKKVKIYFKKSNMCIIETNQQADEWIIMMLTILLLKEGYAFIHAGAVSKEEKALLMPSWGGVGKTASIAKLMKLGYKLLGDDINIITTDGKLYPFPKKFILYFYHKQLFPEVFKSQKVKCGNNINQFYEKIKPFVKKMLRHIPGGLAYARKHNPQTIQVSPIEIFGKDAISEVSQISQIIWIERNLEENNYEDIDIEELASKAVSITLNEIFGNNMQSILIMAGFSQINIRDIFEKMYSIYINAFKNANITGKINVSRKKEVSVVADEILKNIKI